MSPVRCAVIPAAGLGTRLLPATKSQPKEMVPVVDKPAIQYAVEEAAAAGIEDVLIITGRHKETMADHFDRTIELETRTVDIHVAKLRRKIERDAKEPRHLVTVRGAGYRLVVDA